jgi:tetraether lipid synthase
MDVTPTDIERWTDAKDGAPLVRARRAMVATGQWDPRQAMGRRWPIGCVALEITQRCNLDCGACYLSENSESVRDLPLAEIFRRIERIRRHYGAGVDVQVTGGDPTLRRRNELIAIVRRIRDTGMNPSLFTNGIRATRDLLSALAEVGLVDVAFHVDMTQGRRGYANEIALNRLRKDYIERARGLGLSVFFNTTIFDGNIDDMPEVVAFFVRNSDVVRLASFQPQAIVGRGALKCRPARITTEAVIRAIETGAGTTISFDTAHAGHASCNSYGMIFVANGRACDALDDPKLYARILDRMADVRFDRQRPRRALAAFLAALVRNPDVLLHGAPSLASKAWRMRRHIAAARFRVNKLSFVIHNFMDSCALERERLEACIFMVATRDGPVSMCRHNAMRDDFILAPVTLDGAGGPSWDPRAARPAPPRRVGAPHAGIPTADAAE